MRHAGFIDLAARGIAHQSTDLTDKDPLYLGCGECSGRDSGIVPSLERRLIATASGITGIDDATTTQSCFDDHSAAVEQTDEPRRSRSGERGELATP